MTEQAYNFEYEQLCLGMTGEELTEETAHAFKAMRAAQRVLDIATVRWEIVSRIRADMTESVREAQILPLHQEDNYFMGPAL